MKQQTVPLLLATLALTTACSKGFNPVSSENKTMQAITLERSPTAKEQEAALAIANAPVSVEANARVQRPGVEAPSTIAGLNEVIDLGKYMGVEGALVSKGAKTIWNVIEKNQASVDLSSQLISILPTDARTRSRVAGWSQDPFTKGYTVILKNLAGMEVVRYKYAITYSYGGNADGKGKYISNLAVIHSELKVMWGFNIDAQFEVGEVIKSGTPDDPVVGIMGQVKWKVKNVLTNVRKANAFYAFGDGRFKPINHVEKADLVAFANEPNEQ